MIKGMDSTAFLAHIGVKGMRWGVRKSRAEKDRKWKEQHGTDRPTRKQLREKNKIARAENRKAEAQKILDRDSDIRRAREALDSSADQYMAARSQYKIDKQTQGRVQARRALDKAKDDYMSTWDKANELTAKEQTAAAMADIGLALADGWVSANAQKRAAAR